MVTIQFVTYNEIEDLSSLGRIKKILNLAKENKIVLLQGKLTKQEEAELIKTTMEEINPEFKGIELLVVDDKQSHKNAMTSFKQKLVNLLAGERMGFTIVGPANIVKEIKKDPNKIQVMLEEGKRKKRKKK